VKLAYYLVYLPIYAGFLLHRSESPELLIYSRRYVAFLAVLLVPFGFPALLAYLRRRHGMRWRQIALALTPAAVLIAVLYLAAMQVYYYGQEHRFDPFLQVAPVRLPAQAKAAPEDALRVLALGGSTTLCPGLPESARYPAQLQARLAALRGGTAVQVLNAGRPWYTTRHSLIAFASTYQDWKPDVVVVMHASDDLARSFSPERVALGPYDELYAHFYGDAYPGARPPTFEGFWLRRIARWPAWSYWCSMLLPPFREVDYGLDRYSSLAAFERNLRRLATAVRAAGATLVLATEPSLFKPEPSDKERRSQRLARALCNTPRGFGRYDVPSASSLSVAMAAFNGKVRSVAAEEGAVLADAAAQVPKDLRHFVDDRHVTAEGAAVLAAAVAQAIAPAGAPAGGAEPEPERH
jgi:lysophospholipase L1-like esterase